MNNGPKQKPDYIRKMHNIAMRDYGVSEADAELVFWLYSYACDKGLNNTEVARLTGIDASNITRIYELTYNGGKLGKEVLGKIQRTKDDAEVELERELYGHAGFVETRLSKGIFEACHACRVSQEISQIWGEPQTGKSEALKRYAQLNNSGRTRYIELKSGMSHRHFMQYVAECCHVSTSGDVNVLRHAINRVLTPNTLLIFDELHKPILHATKGTRLKIMDSIRDFNDEIGCGIMICGTNTLRDEITQGNMKDFLDQLNRRGVIKVQCPDTLPLPDLWRFAASYGLPQPKAGTTEHQLCQRIIRNNGIGVFSKFLKNGMKYAKNQKERYGWKHFISAHDIIVKRNRPGWC
ncbi:hypothetical protein EGM51_10730 [Verrucomicrobia bacterium S94]|nr:hypothetical protein EGM51_10730 [Verrucomicrobia bacterium S94]